MPENNDWVYFDATCKSCGRTMKDHQPAFLLEMWKKKGEPFPSQCKDCWEAWKKAEEEKDMQAIYDAQLSEEQLDEAVIAAGVAPSYRLKTPPIRFVATWLWKNRDKNLLLSGPTGTGKSTSAGVVTRCLIEKEGKSIRVCYFTGLLDEWRHVRCDNDDPDAIKQLFRKLESVDVLIIDECADKNVNTESSREFMYRLLEDVQNGVCHAKLWMLGNFYRGSVADIFGDADPAYRRLKEKFLCGRIDCVNKKIIPIFK